MLVTKQELNNFGLLEKLPDELKNLSDGNKFVFYYSVDEENLKLKVYEYQTVVEPTILLYRGMQDKQMKYKAIELRLGVFSDNFDTRDGLFFQFLKTYNTDEDVYRFYNSIIEQDEVVDLNVSTNAITEINLSEDFRRSISYFCSNRIQQIMFVYDLVDSALKNKLDKSLYGQTIKKVVNMVKIDGGILPEWRNSLIRYMIIGENANLTEIQKERLKEAELLLRSSPNDIKKVYAKTGWALGKDLKWRTNIADNEARISTVYLQDFGGRKLFVPEGMKPEQVLPMVANPIRMFNGYNGKLSDVLHHPTLYKYYPQLAFLPLAYFFQNKGMTPVVEEPQIFYFSSNERGGFILINGSYIVGDSLSILLHEIQHSIQNIEGFATGGNLFFAQFVSAVGSENVRKIFASINKMQHYFRDYLYDETSMDELRELIEDAYLHGANANDLRKNILDLFESYESYKDNYKSINFYLILLIAEENDFDSPLANYLTSKIGQALYSLFANISRGYSKAKAYSQDLRDKGYTKGYWKPDGTYKRGDIDTVLFKGYENLYGEVESRSVQSSRFVMSEYKNYFYLTHWEMDRIEPFQQLTIIDGVEEIIDFKKMVGACESIEDNYVLHFNKGNSCVPFLHELGHIVYDAIKRLGYEEKIIEEFKKTTFYKDIDEFFVDKFLAYIRDTVKDENISLDMDNMNIVYNDEIGKILKDFFTRILTSYEQESFILKKLNELKRTGEPLYKFKVGDVVFWASEFSTEFLQYGEGVITKMGEEPEIRRFTENPLSKRYKIFKLHKDDIVAMKPKDEEIYMGEENINKRNEFCNIILSMTND